MHAISLARVFPGNVLLRAPVRAGTALDTAGIIGLNSLSPGINPAGAEVGAGLVFTSIAELLVDNLDVGLRGRVDYNIV